MASSFSPHLHWGKREEEAGVEDSPLLPPDVAAPCGCAEGWWRSAWSAGRGRLGSAPPKQQQGKNRVRRYWESCLPLGPKKGRSGQRPPLSRTVHSPLIVLRAVPRSPQRGHSVVLCPEREPKLRLRCPPPNHAGVEEEISHEVADAAFPPPLAAAAEDGPHPGRPSHRAACAIPEGDGRRRSCDRRGHPPDSGRRWKAGQEKEKRRREPLGRWWS